MMTDHPTFIIQREIGESSWFGFSLVLRKPHKNKREQIVHKLNRLGFECRPIVAGSFLKNRVINYADFEVHGDLSNADYIDQNGLFIGNHHYPIPDAIRVISKF